MCRIKSYPPQPDEFLMLQTQPDNFLMLQKIAKVYILRIETLDIAKTPNQLDKDH